jgi:hypothetical protein
MLFVWGKKYAYKKLGYAADFCPICREPQAFSLRRTSLVPHFWYIPTGAGVFVCVDRRCQSCGVAFNGNPERYAAMSRKAGSFADLKPKTFPQFESVERNRLDLEAAIRKDPTSLSPRDRQALIRQPLQLLSPMVQQRFAKVRGDRWVAITAAVAFFLLLSANATSQRPEALEGSELVTLWVLILGMLAVLVQFALSGRRWIRRQLTPLMVRCLGPLKPSQTEVEAAVAEMKQQNHKIGTKVNVAYLMKRLDAARG